MNINEILEKAEEIREAQKKIECLKDFIKNLQESGEKRLTVGYKYEDNIDCLNAIYVNDTDELSKDITKVLEQEISKQKNLLDKINGEPYISIKEFPN